VIFKKSEIETPFPLELDPIITGIYRDENSTNRIPEISNPGEKPINLSNYMLAVGIPEEKSPAEIITGKSENFNDRMKR